MFQVSFSPESMWERSYIVIIFSVSKSAYLENLRLFWLRIVLIAYFFSIEWLLKLGLILYGLWWSFDLTSSE